MENFLLFMGGPGSRNRGQRRRGSSEEDQSWGADFSFKTAAGELRGGVFVVEKCGPPGPRRRFRRALVAVLRGPFPEKPPPFAPGAEHPLVRQPREVGRHGDVGEDKGHGVDLDAVGLRQGLQHVFPGPGGGAE